MSQREEETVSAAGSVTVGTTTFATVRAQLIERSTREAIAAFGDADTTTTAFRIRYRDDVTTSDRILFEGRAFDIKSIKEIGRRRGLDLFCEARE